jgi:hypothetical protein
MSTSTSTPKKIAMPMQCPHCDYLGKTTAYYKHLYVAHPDETLRYAKIMPINSLTKADLIVLIGQNELGKWTSMNTRKEELMKIYKHKMAQELALIEPDPLMTEAQVRSIVRDEIAKMPTCSFCSAIGHKWQDCRVALSVFAIKF